MRITDFPASVDILAPGAPRHARHWPSPAVYYEEWRDFANITFTHGWLVLAVMCCAGAAVEAGNCRRAGAILALALLALGGCILAWLVCYRASIEDLEVTISRRFSGLP